MNLIQLNYFHTVCDCGSVSEAAELLHISQPSLSVAIKELEREFGVSLFRRHHRGMSLTEEGQTLYRISRDLLHRSDEIEKIMHDLGKGRKKLRIGIPPMIGSLILPSIYGKFLSLHPEISLEITEGGRQELQQLLTNGQLDMIFSPHNASFDPSFAYRNLCRLEIVCCASTKNPVAKLDKITPNDLSDVPIVLFEDGFFQTEKIRGWFSKEEVTPKIFLQTKQLSTILRMISENLAVGFLFRTLTENEPKLCAVSAKPSLFVDIGLVWQKGAYPLSSMETLKDFLFHNDPFSTQKN